MQIKIDLKIFIFVIIFAITKNIEIYALLMIFALIHEIGHLVCGIIIGLKPQALSILPYGFKITFKAKLDDYNTKIKNSNILSIKKIILALAGPMTNIAIIIVEAIFKNNLLTYSCENIIYANILIAVFNLIPIYPLDGGKIFQEAIHINKGLWKSYSYTIISTKISITILTILSSFLILYYKNIGILIVTIYVWTIACKSIKEFTIKMKIYKKIDKYTVKSNYKLKK